MLRTVFVCHRVPFLIPQASVMPAGAVCGGGSWCKSRLHWFYCCPGSGVGDGLRGSFPYSLNPGRRHGRKPSKIFVAVIVNNNDCTVCCGL